MAFASSSLLADEQMLGAARWNVWATSLLSGYAIPPTTNRGGRIIDEGGPPRFRRISPLAALPGLGVGCKQRFKPGGSSGLDSQLLATILGPFPTIFGCLGPGPLSEYLTQFRNFGNSVFQQLAMGLCPLEPHRDSGFGGANGLKSYLTVVKIWRFRCVWPRPWA